MIRSVLTAAVLVVATATPASAEPTGYLIWDSDPDGATHGHSATWTPPELFSVREDTRQGNNLIRIKGEASDGWEYIGIELFRHDGQRIGEGHYTDQRAVVIYHGLGSVDDSADFDVEHIAYDADGLIREFDGSLVHGNDRPNGAFRAKISYRR